MLKLKLSPLLKRITKVSVTMPFKVKILVNQGWCAGVNTMHTVLNSKLSQMLIKQLYVNQGLV